MCFNYFMFCLQSGLFVRRISRLPLQQFLFAGVFKRILYASSMCVQFERCKSLRFFDCWMCCLDLGVIGAGNLHLAIDQENFAASFVGMFKQILFMCVRCGCSLCFFSVKIWYWFRSCKYVIYFNYLMLCLLHFLWVVSALGVLCLSDWSLHKWGLATLLQVFCVIKCQTCS